MTDQLENTANPSPLSAGVQLRNAREAIGYSVEDVAGQLKLARRQVEALEREAFAELPSNLFIRGFVRNYARLVKIDAEPLLAYLSNVLPEERVQTALPSVSVDDRAVLISPGTNSRSILLVVALLGVLIGVGVVYWYLQQPSSPDLALPEVSTPEMVEASAVEHAASAVVAVASFASAVELVASATPTSTPIASQASKVASTQASAPQAGEVEVAVAAESDSWVQIVDANGNKVLSEIVRPGYERKAFGKAPFAVKIGNAPKTKLYFHGQAVDLNSYLKPGSDVVNLELK
jgi:cytoskeleton protein RodZ